MDMKTWNKREIDGMRERDTKNQNMK